MLKHGLINLFKNVPKHIQLQTATIANTTILLHDMETKQNHSLESNVNFPTYTPEQQQKILQIVNKPELESLLDYDISKSRATKLNAWKTRNGPLQNIDDILMVESFGIKIVEKFYKSMLEEPNAQSKLKKVARQRMAPFILPNMSAEQRLAIRSCVAVRIGVASVNWARLETSTIGSADKSPWLLTHWQHHEISEKKLHLSELSQRLLYITHQIPMADVYVFENPQMAQISNNPGSVEQQNINIQKSQMTAVLAYEFCARGRSGIEMVEDENDNYVSTKPPQINVFYLRRFLTARLFNQLVGAERVSSEETVKRLMRTYYNINMLQDDVNETSVQPEEALSFRGNVQFPQELREMYARAERYQREFLGQSLLLNLAFVRLVLLQDEESIAAVTRSSSKSESDREC